MTQAPGTPSRLPRWSAGLMFAAHVAWYGVAPESKNVSETAMRRLGCRCF